MFNKSNFCHIASNNRNEQKGSVFIYKTTDTLAQVTQSGYFNEKLIDINLHDLIIHVQYNPVDRTLKKSVLIVTERTLDNVETAPILDQTIGDDLADLGDQVAGIEEKIPGAASAVNQLADKAFVNDIKTAIETTIAGINTSISTLNNDLSQTNQNLSQTNQNLSQTNQNLAQTNQNVDSLQETKQDIATAINYDNITNCITEIPQDIKLELTDGVLTLKAGSKIYVPNGADVFDEVIIPNDMIKTASGNSKTFLVYDRIGNTLRTRKVAESYSGSTTPTSSVQEFWYDTTNNKIGISSNSGSSWTFDCSFPLAVLTEDSSQIVSIDQVFNGFGYIGSTIFALPGVKGLIPNGRNTDGTLSNTVFTVGSVETIGYATAYNDYTVSLSAVSIGIWVADRLVYDEQTNHNLNTQNNSVQAITICGKVSCDGTRITSFTSKTAFRAVDYNDTDFIARQVIASDRRIDLTLGASGASYTAPADGWLVLNKLSSGTSYQFVQFYNTKNADRRIGATTANNAYLCATMPLAKGDRVLVEYSATGATKLFRFIYANGAK